MACANSDTTSELLPACPQAENTASTRKDSSVVQELKRASSFERKLLTVLIEDKTGTFTHASISPDEGLYQQSQPDHVKMDPSFVKKINLIEKRLCLSELKIHELLQ